MENKSNGRIVGGYPSTYQILLGTLYKNGAVWIWLAGRCRRVGLTYPRHIEPNKSTQNLTETCEIYTIQSYIFKLPSQNIIIS